MKRNRRLKKKKKNWRTGSACFSFPVFLFLCLFPMLSLLRRADLVKRELQFISGADAVIRAPIALGCRVSEFGASKKKMIKNIKKGSRDCACGRESLFETEHRVKKMFKKNTTLPRSAREKKSRNRFSEPRRMHRPLVSHSTAVA